MKKLFILSLAWCITLIACSKKQVTNSQEKPVIPVNLGDSEATQETKVLYFNLKKLAPKGVLFGQQDATAYGIGWKGDYNRSDVKDVCGSHPAVHGWDLGDIGKSANLDGVPFDGIRFLIQQAYKRGGINTISMHIDNPVTGGDAWDVTHAVHQILPGGSKHSAYKKLLDLVADFLNSLTGKGGEKIPIIFRPYHEHTGSWFWWGQNNCTRNEFISLWQFTVTYFRDTKKVHHLLWAYSPSGFISDSNYLERYPGDEYVDVLGLDIYGLKSTQDRARLTDQLKRLVHLADTRDKIAALTEVGDNMIPIVDWWTKQLLNPIKSDSLSKKIVYLLVWRNASTGHHFAPYPGHPSVPDFLKFYQDPFTLFEDDLPDVYAY